MIEQVLWPIESDWPQFVANRRVADDYPAVHLGYANLEMASHR
jgi:hypothetical protein